MNRQEKIDAVFEEMAEAGYSPADLDNPLLNMATLGWRARLVAQDQVIEADLALSARHEAQ